MFILYYFKVIHGIVPSRSTKIIMDVVSTWSEHVYAFKAEDYAAGPITSLAYDDFYDTLWVGNSNGRVNSISIINTLSLEEQHQVQNSYDYEPDPFGCNLSRYSSFRAQESVLDILPCEHTVFTVGEQTIRGFSYGGVLRSKFSLASNRFTCGEMVYFEQQDNMYGSTGKLEYIIAGTADNSALLIDPLAQTKEALMKFDVGAPVVKIERNSHIIACAGNDGIIRLFDGKLRSPKLINKIEAHSGAIRDMHLNRQEIDDKTLFTSGFSKRAINPYDKNSPFHQINDPSINAFDLRMQRKSVANTPILIPQMATSGVKFLRFIEPNQAMNVSNNPYFNSKPSVLMVSENGLVQISECDLLGGSELNQPIIFNVPIETDNSVAGNSYRYILSESF